MTKTLAMIASGIILQLDELNRPREFFSTLVHQGCTRNEYHEYDVEESEFGTNGCMFFNLGCKGPIRRRPAIPICGTDAAARPAPVCLVLAVLRRSFPKMKGFSEQKSWGRSPRNCP